MEATQPKEEEEWNGRMTASGVGQKNEDILRCVLVLDKEFRDRNVPFVRFPGIASARPSARLFRPSSPLRDRQNVVAGGSIAPRRSGARLKCPPPFPPVRE